MYVVGRMLQEENSPNHVQTIISGSVQTYPVEEIIDEAAVSVKLVV